MEEWKNFKGESWKNEVNVADFIKEFPENPKQHVHQFNLSKLDATRLLHIW